MGLMICNLCNSQNDHGGGYCGTCGSPLREGGLPHPTYAQAVAQGRAEERAVIVAHMREHSLKFAEGAVDVAADGLPDPLLVVYTQKVVLSLADYFEDGV